MGNQQLRKSTILSRGEIEGLIASGHAIVIVDGKVLKVDAWLPYHPGGDKAIRHMIGRDATDEVHRFHSAQTVLLTDRYQIGRIEGRWTNFLPPIQGGHFRKEGKLEDIDEEDMESTPSQDAASTRTSTDPSPLFDAADLGARKRTAAGVVSSSASSISSVELDDTPSVPRMTVMDARTRREIDVDKARYPSLDPETQDGITLRYRELHERIEAEGLYVCRYSSYGIECIRYAFFFGMFAILLRLGWYKLSAFFLGCLLHQLTFVVHDASHMALTHDFQTDSILAMFIASYLGGLSACWWKNNHNVHHIVTNSPEHDPDIQHVPFFAITHRFFENMFSTFYERVMEYDAFAKFMLQYQDKLYYIIMCFARFNLYRLSWAYLLLGQGPRKGPAWWHRYFETVGVLVWAVWYGYGLVYLCVPGAWNKFAFVMISNIVTAPLHVQITLSHFAMSTADLGPHESFAQKQLRTTMDVDCPPWLDFFHGGLQFQAIHHLFPRIPRHNLRRTQRLVQEFCEEVDVPYSLYGFVEGNQVVIGKLGDVSRQAAILKECQRVMAARGEFGH